MHTTTTDFPGAVRDVVVDIRTTTDFPGAVSDVAGDIRRGSATFGPWAGMEPAAGSTRQPWLSEGRERAARRTANVIHPRGGLERAARRTANDTHPRGRLDRAARRTANVTHPRGGLDHADLPDAGAPGRGGRAGRVRR